MKIKFQTPTGMHDILPDEQGYFRKIYNVCENAANFYQFKKIDTPILEETELFSKGTGMGSDIVQKQMYSLKTKGGDFLTLRPEFTPGIVRAYIKYGMRNLPQPVKLYSIGPVFRYERPQEDRYRQFHQFNLEILGEANPVIDAQIIQIFYNILEELKFKKLIVEINSIGDGICRPRYRKILINYLKKRETDLCADCRQRLGKNPLRVLDCKEEKCWKIIKQAPQAINYLCNECREHFKEVLEFLDEIELPYNLNPYLVRGLDYYTKTVFEIFEEHGIAQEEKKRNALLAGGRYDNLVKKLGGLPTPACGGAIGIERIVNLIKTKEVKVSSLASTAQTKIFLAQLGDLAKRKSLNLLESFRKKKINIAESFSRDSLKSQLAQADKIGVKYTLILGQKEVLENTIIIRDMKTGQQETKKMKEIVGIMKKKVEKIKT
ncbi:MAG: histidine--tRNA ligase [Candidatus Nealsonbacteria bacterium]|nr:histidine--tRNA ligase [Candidatus Nealsonbacteria bacterium]